MIAPIREILRDDPRVDWEDDSVEFRLTYQGTLLSITHAMRAVGAIVPNISIASEKYSMIN
jgi:hypothetical protein